MNKAEVILAVSARSGINAADCEKVLEAFEKILDDELSASPTIGKVTDRLFGLFGYTRTP
ncbi:MULTISPECIES: HU family DNA-binding protein [Silvimonas]|uniref:HU family DNA-binding protein n=1 Tax=Silvimonas TaxID=300264 RepID=UPI0024B3BE72|nr:MULTISPECIES: HU family DNA-binding protein [Silvimonas]MDR3430079.1 HU family DNA-binding protein [Silvimonas sp.]